MTDPELKEVLWRNIGGKPTKPKPQPERHVPSINGGTLPPIGAREVLDFVTKGKGWKDLQQTALEDEAERRAKALERRFAMTPIPNPVWDSEDL
jgi:hypothetical protein